MKWKGCIVVMRGTCVDVVDQQDQWTEIVVSGKHWFTDEMPGRHSRACLPGRKLRDKKNAVVVILDSASRFARPE